MSFIEQVREKRQKLADVLVDEEYSGLREFVEELYPDKAHFIYELLQNAEDAQAKRVEFRLTENGLTFAHDGLPFTEEDVWGITNIGKGTKRDDEDKIGRFGVGFKAIFAYSETPSIWSPTFNFRISDLVLPAEIPARNSNGGATIFQFPFNNLKKGAAAAFAETSDGLQSLSEELLIFLKHVQLVKWEIAGGLRGGLKRVERPPYLIEVQKYIDEKTIASSCFLRFSRPVDDLPVQNVAIAFPLKSKAELTAVPETGQLAEHYRILPAGPSRVSVYFPAEKEVSGLRFHLHAPFVPELSRASIKDTSANDPLFAQLACLAGECLEKIRDLGLLTVDFLNVLPHSSDALPRRYRAIADVITDAMNSKGLTPTQTRTHRPARQLLQAKVALKELLPQEDLVQILDPDGPLDWAVTAPLRNSHADRFLSGLDIHRWDIDQFVDLLARRRSVGQYYDQKAMRSQTPKPDKGFDAWFDSKDAAWLQKLYAMLLKERSDDSWLSLLESARIVRLTDQQFARPSEAFFSKSGIENDHYFPSVDPAVYSSGNNKAEQEAARRFLEAVGVREVGKREQVQAILKSHYDKHHQRSFAEHTNDLKQFIDLIHSEPPAIKDFASYSVLLNTDDEWSPASQLFLETPYQQTGLSVFFEAQRQNGRRKALSSKYSEAGLSDLVRIFATTIGVMSRLEILETSCEENPNANYLVYEAKGNPTRLKIDRDYWVDGLEDALQNPSIALAKLLWKTLVSQEKSRWIRAQYRKNQTQQLRTSLSRLATFLKDSKWVPQKDGEFVKPADADYQSLPDDFEYAKGWEWLSALEFGTNYAKRTEEGKKIDEILGGLGFNDESLKDAQWFAKLDIEARRQLISEYQSRQPIELPENKPLNPEERTVRVAGLAKEAPQEDKEPRERLVSPVTQIVKKETRPYLRRQYTNADGDMICQICQGSLPFLLSDGEPFFETVKLVPKLQRVHFQNYIALCPNHAAMFMLVNDSSESIRELVESEGDHRIPIVLAGKKHEIYFTEKHLCDLRAVLGTETAEPSNNE